MATIAELSRDFVAQGLTLRTYQAADFPEVTALFADGMNYYGPGTHARSSHCLGSICYAHSVPALDVRACVRA